MLFRHGGMKLGKAAHMRLIDDRVLPRRRPALLAPAPFKIGVDDDAFGHERRAVALVERGVVARFHLIAEQGRVPFELSGVAARIGIKKQLVGIEAVPCSGS